MEKQIKIINDEAKKSAINKIKQELEIKGDVLKLKKLNLLIKNEEL